MTWFSHARSARTTRLRNVLMTTALAASLLWPAAPSTAAEALAPVPYRGFETRSYWNTPLPDGAPRHPDSAAMISWLRNDNDGDSIVLAGTGSSGAWGMPIYWSNSSDPSYRLVNRCRYKLPAAFSSIRIPRGARPDKTSDAAMTIFDRSKDLVYALWKADYRSGSNTWAACGGAVYELDSNGLERTVPGSDSNINHGHRGVPPTTYAVRWDEIRDGRIDHILKIAVNTTKCSHVFPMVGDECGTRAGMAPPEGTRIRIKPSVNLHDLHLSPAALTIAKALKRYGAVVGDQSGGPAVLKVENTVAEGRGWLWKGVLNRNSLSKIPLSSFEVVKHGYRP